MFYILITLLIIFFIIFKKAIVKKFNIRNTRQEATSEKTVAYPLNHLGLTKSSDFDKLWE